MTTFPDFFAALAAEFPKDQIKMRSQGNKNLSYITARQVMNRLDEVVGPEFWWDEYIPLEHAVICRLTIRLPDGREVTKSDAGGFAGMGMRDRATGEFIPDEENDAKTGYSDAFKRAAVKWGIGRHLYNDGIPTFRKPPIPPGGSPKTDKDFGSYATARVHKANERFHRACELEFGRGGAPEKDFINYHQFANHLLKWAVETKRAEARADGFNDSHRTRVLSAIYANEREAITDEADRYCAVKGGEAMEALQGITREPGEDDA